MTTHRHQTWVELDAADPRLSQMVSLAWLALDMCHQVVETQRSFIVKGLWGKAFDDYFKALNKAVYCGFNTRKPESSRARSPEVYW